MKSALKISLARKTSSVFSPIIWVTLSVEILLWRFFKDGFLLGWQLLCLSIFFLVLPLGFFFLSVKQGRFDFDLTVKKERFRFFIFVLACSFLGLNLTYYFSQSLFKIFLSLIITCLTFAIVTFWDKASLHVGSLTSSYLVLNFFSGWRYFYLIIILPLVGWSRIILGKHNLAQVLEGFLIPILTVPIGFFLLGVI